MVNNNKVDNTKIQAIRTPTCSTMSNNCLKCDKSHAFRCEACPAFGSKCNTCGKANHWASVCLSNGTKPKQRPRSQNRDPKKPKSLYQPQYRRKQYVKTDSVYNKEEAEEQMESLTFNCINMTQRDEAFILINIKLPNQNSIHKLHLKIDTGAQGNTLPVSIFRRIFPEKLDADGSPTPQNNINKKLIAYNGTPIKYFGNIKIPCQYNKSDWQVSIFHIVDIQGPAVLGLPLLEQLKLITLHCTVKKEDMFQTPAATQINATKDQMQIEYISGQEMTLADTLSCLPCTENTNIIDLDIRVDLVRFRSERLNGIRKETKADPILDQLQGIITAGWPDSIKDLPLVIWSYWPYRDELSVNDGIIMKGSRIIISETQQKIILDQLHYSHQGVEKTHLEARDAVYWERINADIENMTKNCSICQVNLPVQPKETLQPHDIPSRAWEVVSTDLFNCNNHEYLISADYYSKFPIIWKMNGLTTSNMVISAMKQIFSEHGIPSRVDSDNGPLYSSEAFKEFAQQWQFDHITSSPVPKIK